MQTAKLRSQVPFLMRFNVLNGGWKHPFQIISGWCTLDSRDSSCKCDLSFCSAQEIEISENKLIIASCVSYMNTRVKLAFASCLKQGLVGMGR